MGGYRPLSKSTEALREIEARRTPLYTSYSLTTLTGNANFSHAKADRALGYTVRPFRETVADTIAWLKKAKRI